MKALLITLKLETPLLMTGVSNGEENSSYSLPYIPGNSLRGALVTRYLQKYSPADPATDHRSKLLFFGEQVHYLNAYPIYGEDTRTLPLPASWYKRKEDHLKDKPKIYDFALGTNPKHDTPISAPFVSPVSEEDGLFMVIEPKEELATHIASQGRGVVQRGESTVFQYQALARDQRFIAVIAAEDGVDLTDIEKLLSTNTLLFLGRSRSAGYGRVLVEKVVPNNNWVEVEENYPENVTIITLLSDTLLLDEYGQPTHDLDGYLSRFLGQPIENVRAFIQPTVVGGFNRKWGTPLPQFPALGMGSVFVYDVHALSPNKLTKLIANGIGERRVDGFGRIAINWPGEPSIFVEKYNPEAYIPPLILSPASQKLALEMSTRLLIQRLESQLVAHAQKIEIRGKITNHVASRLRNALRQAINQEECEVQPIQDFLEALKPIAKNQFERVRVVQRGEQSGPRLWSWLIERLKAQDGLDFFFSGQNAPIVAGRQAMLENNTKLKCKYTLRFIEAVIDGKMKQNRKEGVS